MKRRGRIVRSSPLHGAQLIIVKEEEEEEEKKERKEERVELARGSIERKKRGRETDGLERRRGGQLLGRFDGENMLEFAILFARSIVTE